MNLEELQRTLVRAARSRPVNDHVPYAFEKRIMALIRDCKMIDRTALWSGALWKAAGPCVAVMLLLGAWAYFTPASPFSSTATTAVSGSENLSQDLDNTLLAAGGQEQEQSDDESL
jgi:hypothetical protein